MAENKKVREKLSMLPKNQKMQIVIAGMLTLLLLLALPVVAWFVNSKKASGMVKVNAPTVLTIGAGANDSSDMIDLSNINVEEKIGDGLTPEADYVFAVRGKFLKKYDLQIARTTNIPFTYKVYRVASVKLTDNDSSSLAKGYGTTILADKDKLENGTYGSTSKRYQIAEYVSSKQELWYYPYSTENEVQGEYLNSKIRSVTAETIGNGQENLNFEGAATFHIYNYSNNYGNVNEYAEPLYWQQTELSINPDGRMSNGDSVDYYVLKLIWDSSFTNSKETDMIYITAKRSA